MGYLYEYSVCVRTGRRRGGGKSGVYIVFLLQRERDEETELAGISKYGSSLSDILCGRGVWVRETHRGGDRNRWLGKTASGFVEGFEWLVLDVGACRGKMGGLYACIWGGWVWGRCRAFWAEGCFFVGGMRAPDGVCSAGFGGSWGGGVLRVCGGDGVGFVVVVVVGLGLGSAAAAS